MKVAIYGPVSLWEYHHATTIDLAWREHQAGSEIVLMLCREALASCPANPKNLKRKCLDCVNQNKYSINSHFPLEVKFSWISPSELDKEVKGEIKSIKTQEELEAFNFGDWEAGKATLSHLISEFRSVSISNEIVQTEGAKILEGAVSFYESAKRILSEGFEKIYIWGGRRASESCVIAAATCLGIPIFYYEIGSSSSKYNVSKNFLHSFAGIQKEIQDWSESNTSFLMQNMSQISAQEYFQRIREGRGSDPHYRNFLEGFDNSLPSGLKSTNKPILSIFTSSAWEFAMFPDVKRTSEDFQDAYGLIRRIVNDQVITGHYLLAIRWHPNLRNASGDERQLMSDIISNSPWVVHVSPEDQVNSYDLVNCSDVIVSTGSTIGLESVVMGKPSILLGVAQYSGLDSVYEPLDYEEFSQVVLNNPKPLSKTGAYKWADWMGNFGENFHFVKVLDSSYWINGKRIKYRKAWSRLIDIWLNFKHFVKTKLLSSFIH